MIQTMCSYTAQGYTCMVQLLYLMFKLMMTDMSNPICCCAAQGGKASTAAAMAADDKNLDPSYLFRCNPWSQSNYSRYKFMVMLILIMFSMFSC